MDSSGLGQGPKTRGDIPWDFITGEEFHCLSNSKLFKKNSAQYSCYCFVFSCRFRYRYRYSTFINIDIDTVHLLIHNYLFILFYFQTSLSLP